MLLLLLLLILLHLHHLLIFLTFILLDRLLFLHLILFFLFLLFLHLLHVPTPSFLPIALLHVSPLFLSDAIPQPNLFLPHFSSCPSHLSPSHSLPPPLPPPSFSFHLFFSDHHFLILHPLPTAIPYLPSPLPPHLSPSDTLSPPVPHFPHPPPLYLHLLIL